MNLIMSAYEQPFMRDALLAALLAGSTLAYLGIFIVLRRTVFLGAALPQLAALGVAVALVGGFAPVAGALLGALLGPALLSLISTRSRVPPDGVIGIGFAFATSLAILLLAGSAQGESHVLQILSGDILGSTPEEIAIMASVFGMAALVHVACWKEFVYVSYDPEMAATLGLRVRIWDGLLFITIGACVALALRVSGAVVSFAFLVGPASGALLLSRRLPVIVPLAIFLGAIAAAAGLTMSFMYELPSGPTIAACAIFPVLPASIWRVCRSH
jgi:ABC-type Mn2+/Zn2+ transport system permease subunit